MVIWCYGLETEIQKCIFNCFSVTLTLKLLVQSFKSWIDLLAWQQVLMQRTGDIRGSCGNLPLLQTGATSIKKVFFSTNIFDLAPPTCNFLVDNSFIAFYYNRVTVIHKQQSNYNYNKRKLLVRAKCKSNMTDSC